jgi:shikimate kinase
VERSGSDARRSTRLSLQIPVVITSLDPASNFREECKTVVVNVHGCGVIVHEQLESEVPIMVELLSSGARKKASVVAAIPTVQGASWLLGVAFDSPENFWQVDKPPADWGT